MIWFDILSNSNTQRHIEEYITELLYCIASHHTRNFLELKMQANLDHARLHGGIEKRAAVKSRVIVGEWLLRMVTIENTPPILSAGAGRAKGCVNNVRLSTFIREIWRENFVNETQTNKRSVVAQKGLWSRCGVKVPFANSLVVCFHSYNNNINDFLRSYWRIREDACWRTSDLLIRYNGVVYWGGLLSRKSECR